MTDNIAADDNWRRPSTPPNTPPSETELDQILKDMAQGYGGGHLAAFDRAKQALLDWNQRQIVAELEKALAVEDAYWNDSSDPDLDVADYLRDRITELTGQKGKPNASIK